MFANVLSKDQLKVIKKIHSLPEGAYMAGGTALTLQFGHRTSLDFDFYTEKHFETEKILAGFQSDFSQVKVEKVAKDTLIFEVDGISLSLFYYPYRLIKPLVNFGNISLASIEDIAAMKMIAISMRGKRRDFIDVYYLLKKFSLSQIIEFTLKKYPSYQPMVMLKGLIYFKDAEGEDFLRKIEIFDKDFSWEKAKEKIFKEVEKYNWKEVAP